MKIAIFGSSFNPIHLGHQIMMEQTLERLNLDKVLLVPTKNPYHKKTDLLDFEDRIKLLTPVREANDRFIISTIENNISGNSYTFDVINLLKQEYKSSEFYFIMGSDSLLNFSTWYKWKDLIKMTKFIVFKRPNDENVDDLVSEYRNLGMEIEYFDDLQFEISSTYIRNSVKNNKSIRYLVDEKVIGIIESNGYYKD